MKTFAKGLWGELADRIFEVAVGLVGMGIYLYRIGFSWLKFKESGPEGIAIFVSAIGLLIIWHAFRSAYSVSKEIRQEASLGGEQLSPILSASGTQMFTPMVPLYLFPEAKLYGIAICLSFLVICSTIFVWSRVTRPVIDLPPTLADLFEKDFPNVFKGASEVVLDSTADGTALHIKTHVYMDFPAKTQFIAFYLPFLPNKKTFDVSIALIDAVQPMLEKLDKNVTVGGDMGGVNKAQELVFSGRVFLYYEQPLSNLQKAKIVEAYHARHYDVNFRGLDYLAMQLGR